MAQIKENEIKNNKTKRPRKEANWLTILVDGIILFISFPLIIVLHEYSKQIVPPSVVTGYIRATISIGLMIGVWKLVSRIYIPIPKTFSIIQKIKGLPIDLSIIIKFLDKLMNFMGVKDEGWKRIIIVIFPIYFIYYIWWWEEIVDEEINILIVAIIIFVWVFGIKTITKIITWIREGFKKN